jgi:hypothetical protein
MKIDWFELCDCRVNAEWYRSWWLLIRGFFVPATSPDFTGEDLIGRMFSRETGITESKIPSFSTLYLSSEA